MRAIVEFAMDRDATAMMEAFVRPLDQVLRNMGEGRVHRCDGERPCLTFVVRLKLARADSLDVVLRALAEMDAPVGTLVYRLNWLGRKCDYFVLGPEAEPNERSSIS